MVQYKLAQTCPVNVARMRDDPTSVVGRYDTTFLLIAASSVVATTTDIINQWPPQFSKNI